MCLGFSLVDLELVVLAMMPGDDVTLKTTSNYVGELEKMKKLKIMKNDASRQAYHEFIDLVKGNNSP